MWEDPVNKGGGRWVLNLDRRQRLHELNSLWLETVNSLVTCCSVFRCALPRNPIVSSAVRA